MASLFSAISSSLSGLQATTAQMQLISNNISNAGQAGYTRKSAILAPVELGAAGGGTQVTGYTRAVDEALARTLGTTLSSAGYLGAQNEYMNQVQTILGQTGNGSTNPPLVNAVSQLSKAFNELAATPESNVQQQQVVQAAANLVAQIKSAAAAVEALDRQITTDVGSTLSDLNSNLAQIKQLNQEISKALGAGLSAGNLQDQRDQLVQKVSGMMSVTVMERAQGAIALYTPNGYMLMDGAQVRDFVYNGTNITDSSDPTLSLNAILTGGSLEAAAQFRATSSPASTTPGVNVIQKLRSQLDTLVGAFTTSTAGPPASFAYAYANATTATGEAASIFTGTDRNSIAVTPTLLDGSETIKIACANAVVDTFNNSTKSFTGDGLTLNNASYGSLVTSILANFQQAASTIAQQSDTATAQQTYLQNKMTSATGVDINAEMVNLTTLQNAYAASARVISIIQSLFTTLMNIAA